MRQRKIRAEKTSQQDASNRVYKQHKERQQGRNDQHKLPETPPLPDADRSFFIRFDMGGCFQYLHAKFRSMFGRGKQDASPGRIEPLNSALKPISAYEIIQVFHFSVNGARFGPQ